MKTTRIKKMYYVRFVFRIIIFLCAIGICVYNPDAVLVMKDFNMFKTFNVLHVFFIVWLAEIVMQFFPLTGYFSIGTLKHFKSHMHKAEIKDELQHLKTLVKNKSRQMSVL